jgi:excisionase family DNA binding protein
MSELLTAKQVQDLLKIDRTTIYRMLKDGRLNGVKVGQQWRFPREDVESILSGANTTPANGAEPPSSVLPVGCLQPVQDVFADMAEVGAVTTTPNGTPLTKISNSCRFCSLILSTESGRRACVASWQKVAADGGHRPHFTTCHAGLQYARAPIDINGTLAAVLIAGQFYATPPDPAESVERIRSLARSHGVDEQELTEAAAKLSVLDERTRSRIANWLERVSHTFEHVGQERAALLSRLRRIAAMSTLEVP